MYDFICFTSICTTSHLPKSSLFLYDWIGALIYLAGVSVMLFAPRSS
ncbi:hypothetical protein [Bacillus pumilus]